MINFYVLLSNKDRKSIEPQEGIIISEMIEKVGMDLPAGTKCKIYGCTADALVKMKE